MRFYLFNHQNKGMAFVKALESIGWKWTASAGAADVIFSDIDTKARATQLQAFHRAGKKIFIYPHAARPNLFNDFPGYEPFPHIACQFVVSEGHIAIMRAYGYPYPLEPVGWSLCPQKTEFIPRAQARKILFAPIHPNSDGSLAAIQRTMNIDTYKKLIPLVEAGEIDLTVRYINDLHKNGLWDVLGVIFKKGRPVQDYEDIDRSDLVIAHQTYAWLSVARRVPTLMMGEYNSPVMCENGGDAIYVKSWEKYRDLLMYPLDILDEEDTRALFARAIAGDEEIADWRRRLIGDQFDPKKFVQIVARYV